MGDYLMSLIKANDIQNASGGIPTVKGQQLIPTAWVNFNGTGTVAIRDSEGVSSITDNGTGDYTVTFTVAMANTNYSTVIGGTQGMNTSTRSDTVGKVPAIYNVSTGSVTLICGFFSSSFQIRDFDLVNAAIMGGQA